jgi:putative transposase
MTAHVRRYHSHYQGSGHVWQGRFKAFPIQDDAHLLTVARYVERNPLRAGLVDRAQAWPWSSLRWWQAGSRSKWLEVGPLPRPANWVQLVNKPQSQAEVDAISRCVNRGRPFGAESWTVRIAAKLGIESSLQPRGRPRKNPEADSRPK